MKIRENLTFAKTKVFKFAVVCSFVFDCVLIHYGELALKGLNRPVFEKKLMENVSRALDGLDHGKIKKIQGGIILELTANSDTSAIENALKKVFGVSWFAFCFVTKAQLGKLEELVGERFKIEADKKVRVSAKRADKTLTFTSVDVNRSLGKYLVEKFNVGVSLKNPEEEIFVELVNGEAYVFDKKFKGLYGLPVGVSGKILHLLSGGIDSPVAAWLLMKRGCQVDCLHFHAFREYDESKNAKVLKLAKVLAQYCFTSRIFFVPFYPFQVEAVDASPKYRLILFRRFMLRVAEGIAKANGIQAIGTGENIAQVSSQTLENIAVINDAASLPVLRPLLTYEKNEIVNLAKQIGTFEISIEPYKDCCSLFVTKHPATKAKLEMVEAMEEKMNLENAICESLEKTVAVKVGK